MGVAAQAQRQSVHRAVPALVPNGALVQDGGEAGPACRGGVEVDDGHGLPRSDAVDAGALVGLDLHQLGPVRLLAGGGHHAEPVVRVDEHDPCRVRGQQRHAVPDEPVQHVDDVVVGDQGVGQPDERIGKQSLAVVLGAAHDRPSPRQ
jgi:hypothetical protein